MILDQTAWRSDDGRQTVPGALSPIFSDNLGEQHGAKQEQKNRGNDSLAAREFIVSSEVTAGTKPPIPLSHSTKNSMT